jgi:5-methylcytosine-specific restriction endonuclease McrA
MTNPEGTLQVCAGCNQIFPSTLEYFNKGQRTNGLQSSCKPCQKKISDNWYRSHREYRLVQTKAYAQSHLEQRRQIVRNYRLRYPDRKRAQAAQTREKRRLNGKQRKDEINRVQSGRNAIAQKRYRQKNPEAVKLSNEKHLKKLKSHGLTPSLRWKKNHPDKYLNHSRVRTIGRQHMKAHGVTAIGIYERDGGKCHLCHRHVSRKAFTLDHIIPKSKGGPGSWENLALAHLRCNITRGVDRIPAQYRLF